MLFPHKKDLILNNPVVLLAKAQTILLQHIQSLLF
uniref:Uncharacterized protein n=1 Tax=Setaria italica TaxID=4555 RepID=K3XTV9_SETIT